MSYTSFRNVVWKFYVEHGRHELPWRKTHNPYKILVSEIMLQQTQVDRVIPYYKNFIQEFPNVQSLAKAPLSKVLIAWQGLGYNRRAKMLHLAVKKVTEEYKAIFPKTVSELEALPGIGPYTARAVAAFAYKQDVVFVETNIRTVITHHFFKNKQQVDDKDILAILEEAKPIFTKEKGSREWNAALMDYGAHLKRTGIRINVKSKTYSKQSKFTGSDREARGTILKALAKNPQTKVKLLNLLEPARKSQMESQLKKLFSEQLISFSNRYYRLGN